MVMHPDQVHAQGLWHRGFILLLTDRNGRLSLRRNLSPEPKKNEQWDVAGSGHVGSKETVEGAAERSLPLVLREQGMDILHRFDLDSGLGTGREFVSVFEARVPNHQVSLLTTSLEFMFVDQDEFTAMVTHYPELVSQNLLTVWNSRLHLFTP